MRRRHLFEFTDLSGLPQLFRCFVTEFLTSIVSTVRPFEAKAGLLVDALRAAGDARIVDLCSGGGGPWRQLGRVLRTRFGRSASIVLTDKFPNPDALRWIPKTEAVTYWPHPVDASNVPAELAGMRTLFDGFHHFRPDRAEKILRDAICSGQAIAIYEALQRRWTGLCVALCSPIGVLLLSPFVTPFRWSRLLMTYVLPLAPLLITWDAVVSTLRCYTPEELLAMAIKAGGEDYVWSAGAYWTLGVPVTYLVGYPRADAAAVTSAGAAAP